MLLYKKTNTKKVNDDDIKQCSNKIIDLSLLLAHACGTWYDVRRVVLHTSYTEPESVLVIEVASVRSEETSSITGQNKVQTNCLPTIIL